jgi:hypothetical protein
MINEVVAQAKTPKTPAGTPHTFHMQPEQQDLRPVVLGFLDKHLKN